MNYFETVGPALLVNTPILIAWLVGIVLAVRMIRQGGGKAQYLLLIGCSLMFLAQIAKPFLMGLVPWMVHEQGISRAGAIGLYLSLPGGVLNMAGIVCLVYAFWIRWKTRSTT